MTAGFVSGKALAAGFCSSITRGLRLAAHGPGVSGQAPDRFNLHAVPLQSRWPSGQYCAIHTDRGIIGCSLYDCSVATRFGMAIAIARGTPEHPLFDPKNLLTARIVEVSESAKQMGITVGMIGNAALQQMLKSI